MTFAELGGDGFSELLRGMRVPRACDIHGNSREVTRFGACFEQILLCKTYQNISFAPAFEVPHGKTKLITEPAVNSKTSNIDPTCQYCQGKQQRPAHG